MVVEPAKKNLLWGQAEELLEGLILVEESVELRVQLNVDLAEQTAADDLPNEAKNKMLTDFDNITGTNIHNRATDTLGGLDDDVVVLAHLEGIEVLCLLSRDVHNSLVDGVGDAVVDQLGKDQAVPALVEHFESIGRERQPRADVRVASKDGIDMASELGSLVFVDGVCDIGIRSLNLNFPAHASLGGMATSALRNNATTGGRGSRPC